MEDSQIIELLFAREERAIQEIDLHYGKPLYHLANNILHCPEDAEEQVSETYLKAWTSIPPNWPRKLYAYLAKICRNLSLNALERTAAVKRRAQILQLTQELEQCIPDPLRERELESRELSRILNAFLHDLSEENRLLFLRRYWYGDSIQEIAQRYHCKEGTVAVRLHRTRRQLALYLQKEGIYL